MQDCTIGEGPGDRPFPFFEWLFAFQPATTMVVSEDFGRRRGRLFIVAAVLALTGFALFGGGGWGGGAGVRGGRVLAVE
jgi:hypothetical protein